ncbi:hypothetical protein ABZ942_14725 [Nocardia sp. NPDC046473]|uniref:hypothetical protein n=1 Tax=Nocardia sp. NPDC046473 TaxID=3155733 RepID=UPI0033FDD6C2
MSGERTSGFFRRAAEGREVSGFFGRGGKGQSAEGRDVGGPGQDAQGLDWDAASRGAQGDRVADSAGWRAADSGDRAARGSGRSADGTDPHTDQGADGPDLSSDRAAHGSGRPDTHAGRTAMGSDRSGPGWRRNADGPDDSEADTASRSAGAANTSGDRTRGFFRRSTGSGDHAGNPEQDTASERTHGDQDAGATDWRAEDADMSGDRAARGAEDAGGQPKGAVGEGVPDGMAEFVAELKLLAESVLERVEPVLRQAADGQVEWSSCSWCPVCAAAALMRGQHHEVLQTVADHGTAIVTVLREALAGVPVDPVMPESDPTGGPQHNHGVPQDYSTGTSPRAESAAGQHTSRSTKRSRYVSIPVTIKA